MYEIIKSLTIIMKCNCYLIILITLRFIFFIIINTIIIVVLTVDFFLIIAPATLKKVISTIFIKSNTCRFNNYVKFTLNKPVH